MKERVKALVLEHGCKLDQYMSSRHPHGVAQLSASIKYQGKQMMFVRKYFSGNGDSVSKVLENLKEQLNSFIRNG